MEHVEVNDKVRAHRIYRDLLCGGFGYGARRWTATLERMCERLSLYSISGLPTTDFPGGTHPFKHESLIVPNKSFKYFIFFFFLYSCGHHGRKKEGHGFRRKNVEEFRMDIKNA